MSVIINNERFTRFLEGFKMYIEVKSGEQLNSFADNSFFQSEEGYKADLQSKVLANLSLEKWQKSLIGTGFISEKALEAINDCGNLVHYQQKIHFKNKLEEDVTTVEQVLYYIFCGTNDRKAFNEAVKCFGGKYDLLGYLFFIKDAKKYLPIRSTEFDKRFAFLGIPFSTTRKCSAQNYFEYISIMGDLRELIQNKYGFEVSLLDAHSVIWQLEEADRYVSMIEERQADAALLHEVNQNTFSEKEKITEYIIQPKEKSEAIVSNGQRIYPRNRQIALNAIRHAGYCCEINSKHESFIRRNSEYKYMEPHHLIPMSFSDRFENSLDNEANIVSLCSNCHNEIHYGKDAYKLIEKLYNQRKNVLSQAGIEITFEELIKAYK